MPCAVDIYNIQYLRECDSYKGPFTTSGHPRTRGQGRDRMLGLTAGLWVPTPLVEGVGIGDGQRGERSPLVGCNHHFDLHYHTANTIHAVSNEVQ